jgi:aspartyl-tRNA(Asn)/glutamyl-tRNA(Gln) amidotransferase subunit A
MAMGSSLDQIGVLARSPEDARIIFQTIRGNDMHDGTTLPDDVWKNTGAAETKAGTNGGKKKYTIGVPRHFMKQGVEADVLANFDATLKALEATGRYTIKEVELPNIDYSLAVYYIVMPAESSSNLSRFDGVKYGAKVDGANGIEDYIKTRTEGFGPEVKRRIILGNYILSAGYYDAYYRRALAARELMRSDFAKAFGSADGTGADGVDFIATPTSPTPAFKIGEKASDPLQMYLADIFTVTANLVAVPGISAPSGFADRDGKKLPLGTQFMAPWGKDDTLFDVAEDVKKVMGQ